MIFDEEKDYEKLNTSETDFIRKKLDEAMDAEKIQVSDRLITETLAKIEKKKTQKRHLKYAVSAVAALFVGLVGMSLLAGAVLFGEAKYSENESVSYETVMDMAEADFNEQPVSDDTKYMMNGILSAGGGEEMGEDDSVSFSGAPAVEVYSYEEADEYLDIFEKTIAEFNLSDYYFIREAEYGDRYLYALCIYPYCTADDMLEEKEVDDILLVIASDKRITTFELDDMVLKYVLDGENDGYENVLDLSETGFLIK